MWVCGVCVIGFDFGYVVCCVHLLLMLFAIQLGVGLISVGSSRLGWACLAVVVNRFTLVFFCLDCLLLVCWFGFAVYYAW